MIHEKLIGRKNTSASYLIYNDDGHKNGRIVWDNNKKVILSLTDKIQFGIVTNPSDAQVTIVADGYYQDQYGLTTYPGTEVWYEVKKEGYIPQYGNLTLTDNTTIKVDLVKDVELVTITIDTIPCDAKVNLVMFDTIIPSQLGKLKSFGVSAVAADDVDGAYAKKCFCFVTENGAFVIVKDMDDVAPTIDEIKNTTFYTGDYTDHDSAVWHLQEKWEPAIAETAKDRINYYVNGKVVRNIRFSTLDVWGWRDGNLSHVIDGYTYTIDNNGKMFLYYNGELVLDLE